MNPSSIHRLTNDYSLSRLVSLAKLDFAEQFPNRDTRGPYVVVQDGYDPEDVTMQVRQFILSRDGEWLEMGWFTRMPVKERRQAFMFGTVVEVMTMMADLIGPVRIMRSKPDMDGDADDDGVQDVINENA